jgi:hypothetical protein
MTPDDGRLGPKHVVKGNKMTEEKYIVALTET